MKRIYATPTLMGFLATGAYAQRYCDIETVLVSPAEACSGNFPIKYLFINHGPDAILATDTLYGLDPEITDPEDGNIFTYFGEAVAVGDTLIGYDDNPSLDLTGTLVNATGDAYVAAPFANGSYLYFATFLGFSDSTVVKDTVRSNNADAHTITINCGGTSITDIKGLDRTQLFAFPNPAQNAVSFKYIFKAGNAVARITDIAGRVVLTQDFGKQSAGEKTLSVDVSALNNGMYYIELVTAEQRAISKITIRK